MRNNVILLSDVLERCTIEATYADIRRDVNISSGVISRYLNFLYSKGLAFKIVHKRVGKKKVHEGYTVLVSKKGREFLDGCREFKDFSKHYLQDDVI